MKKNVAISVQDVGIRFNLNHERVDNLKEFVIKFLRKDLKFNEFWALNGSGKSTLLKVVSGVLKPSAGHIETSGVIAPLLELGAGFSPEYTGRENIYLYGSVLGYSKEFLDEKFDEIVDFSGLGEFIEVPIKNYSSGMKARLGFVTVLFVSHSLEQVKRLCDRAIILDSGRLVAEGPVDKIARVYKNMTE